MSAARRVLVISKRSAYDLYVRQKKVARVIALLDRNDATVARLLRADSHHAQTVDEVRAAIDHVGWRATFRERDRIGEVAGFDLVISVGGDGTLMWVSHSVGDTPMLGVNSAPQDSVGFLCGTYMGAVREHLVAIEEGRVARVRAARMQVAVDGAVVQRRVLNDVLFAHPVPAITSKYILEFGGACEEQKSSGLWVSTAAGSTAAIRSAGGRPMPFRSRMLQYAVREPYLAPGAEYQHVRGFVHPDESLRVRNKMRDARLYADGSRNAVSVELGQIVEFSLSDEPLVLMGVSPHAILTRKRGDGMTTIPPPRAHDQ
jgi:NAD+ kinase